MQNKPIMTHLTDDAWESDQEYVVGDRESIRWQTLVSGEHTTSAGLTFGVAEIMPGGRLRLHHHEPAETYYIMAGVGVVEIDGAGHEVGAGTAVFIPGNARHRIMNTGTTVLQFIYTFPTNSFEEVVYHFDEE